MLDHIEAMKCAVAPDTFYSSMYAYILERFMLDSSVTETNLLLLAKESLRRQHAAAPLTEDQLVNAFSKSDCRGTNSIIKKKVLLMMHLEKKLGVHIDDRQSADIETTGQLAAALFALLQEAHS
ncbi:MAG: hypothetical protein IJY28_09380 [Clostridia bacterium]|nr:hypothetical protein [Clostridia bacterium]